MSAHTPGPWTSHWTEDNKRAHLGHWYFRGSNSHGVSLTAVTRLNAEAAANANVIAAAPDMLAALERANRLIKEALPKFDWGASPLDANAIGLLNEVPGEVRAALAKARGK